MADHNQRGLLGRFWGRDGRLTPELLADVLLMVTLADGRLSEREIDALSFAVAHRPELAGLDWDWLFTRADELAEDAPLFSDLREALPEAVTDATDRRLILTLANRVAGADGEVAEEEEALMRSVASAFGIGETEQAELLRPPPPGAPIFTWRRVQYAFPQSPPVLFFDALATAREPSEIRLLIHRLHAIRALWNQSYPGGEMIALGHAVPVGSDHFRVDGVFRQAERTKWVRTLAAGESLFPEERTILPALLADRPPNTDVVIAHSGPLSPPDKVFFELTPSLDVIFVKV